MATTPTKADGTTDGELLMATGGLAGALIGVKEAQHGECIIGTVEVEMDDGYATNVLRVEMYGVPFKVTVEHA